jgi:hypothetical protein
VRIGPDGVVYVIAGNGIQFPSGDGGLAINAGLLNVTAVAVDRSGNVYIGEYDGVRKVTPDGIIRTIAGGGTIVKDGIPATSFQLKSPSRIVLDAAGNLYICDGISATGRTRASRKSIQTA